MDRVRTLDDQAVSQPYDLKLGYPEQGPDLAKLVRNAAVGARWTAGIINKRMPQADAACPHCGEADADLRHDLQQQYLRC